jgi:two-component system OmpR family response regulator
MRLLVVEDEPALAAQLRDTLSAGGFAVDISADGDDALSLGSTEPYDAIVLDLGLPGVDGVSVVRRWRQKGRSMPVLLLTGWSDGRSRADGLNAGADDYMGKPFLGDELLARLRALIRRTHGFASPMLACGPLLLDTVAGHVTVNNIRVSLTAREFRTLSYLMHRQGCIVSQSELAGHIYDLDDERESNTIEVFVGRIRRKLGVNVIKTVRGLGYRLQAP